MQSEVNQEENLNRIITVPNLLSFFRLCLIPVIIWSYCCLLYTSSDKDANDSDFSKYLFHYDYAAQQTGFVQPYADRHNACVISSVMIRYGVINQQYFSALFIILI